MNKRKNVQTSRRELTRLKNKTMNLLEDDLNGVRSSADFVSDPY